MRMLLLRLTFIFAISCTAKSQTYFVVKDSCDFYITENVSKTVVSPMKVVGIKDGVIILGNPYGEEKTWKTLIYKDKPDISDSSFTYWAFGDLGRVKCLSIDLEHDWVVYKEWISRDVPGDTYFFYLDREATKRINNK